MASLELKETEEIAKQYSNGNMSKFVRDLIREYHHKQLRIQEVEKNDNKVLFFQNIMFIFLGVTFLIFALSSIMDYLLVFNMALMVISGLLLIIYVLLNVNQHMKIKGVI